jgi:hypothetical protein
LSEFEGYLKRPWVDSVFFSFDVPAEYMASYGRENAYLMSFAGLLLTLDFLPEQKEALLVYLTPSMESICTAWWSKVTQGGRPMGDMAVDENFPLF